MPTDDSRNNLRFAESVPPDDSVQLTYDVDREATIDEVDVRIYRGPELDLEVRPFVVDGDHEVPLVTFIGKDYIDGDGDFFEFALSEPVTPGETLGVEVVNRDTEYAYDFSVDISLDHAGGTSRSATGLLGRWL